MTVKREADLAVLTKEQAEAIEGLRTRFSDLTIVERRLINGQLYQHRAVLSIPLDIFIRALYVGYTVEKTQEEREADVKAYHESIREECENLPPRTSARLACQNEAVGVKRTLNLLGIKIGGVNA